MTATSFEKKEILYYCICRPEVNVRDMNIRGGERMRLVEVIVLLQWGLHD